MNIKYKNQPNNSKLCGQTVLAMLFNTDIIKICEILGHHKGTPNKDIYKVLNYFKQKYKYKRCKNYNLIPNLSIIKLGFTDYNETHWVLKINNKYYDPSLGIIEKYNDRFIYPISYISIHQC